MEDFVLSCLESRIEENRNLYARFLLGPFIKGQALTVGTALRRALLSSVESVGITAISIQGITHEFSTIPGVRESVLELSLNFQKIVLCYQKDISASKKFFEGVHVGYLQVQGPKVIYANDLKLPLNIGCVDPTQYIATLSTKGLLVVKFLIGKANTTTDLANYNRQSNMHHALQSFVYKTQGKDNGAKNNGAFGKQRRALVGAIYNGAKYQEHAHHKNLLCMHVMPLRGKKGQSKAKHGIKPKFCKIDPTNRVSKVCSLHQFGDENLYVNKGRFVTNKTKFCKQDRITHKTKFCIFPCDAAHAVFDRDASLLFSNEDDSLLQIKDLYNANKWNARASICKQNFEDLSPQKSPLPITSVAPTGLQKGIKLRFVGTFPQGRSECAYKSKICMWWQNAKYQQSKSSIRLLTPLMQNIKTFGKKGQTSTMPNSSKGNFVDNKKHNEKQRRYSVLEKNNAFDIFKEQNILKAKKMSRKSLSHSHFFSKPLSFNVLVRTSTWPCRTMPLLAPTGHGKKRQDGAKRKLLPSLFVQHAKQIQNVRFNGINTNKQEKAEFFKSDLCFRNIIPLDFAVTPINQVNFIIETDNEAIHLYDQVRERIVLEVWTNGSIQPRQAVHEATLSLIETFSALRATMNLTKLIKL